MNCSNCGAVKSATDRIREDRKKQEIKKLLIVCGTVVLVAACVCGTVLGMYTIKKQQETIIEQQYALNMQYASLMDLLSGAEITETTTNEADSGDGGTAVAGENNTVVWGDMDGDSENNEE